MRRWLSIFSLLLTAFSALAITRPTGYGAVPGYRPPALGHGSDISLASAWRGRWSDITGYYNIGMRLYDPVAGMWLTYDSVWNERDPNYLSFCGGDPVNSYDSDGRLSKRFYQNPDGLQNTPPGLNFGVAPIMQTSLETTTYFQNGTSAASGLSGQPDLLYDPSQVIGKNYYLVTQPTGDYGFYVSRNPLPDIYGLTTVTPVSKWDVEQQQRSQFLIGSATILTTVMTDTEEFAPDILGTEGTAMRNIVRFQGMEVRSVRDLSHLDKGTLEAMQQYGFAGTTESQDTIILHHLGQNPAGPVVEIPSEFHSIGNKVQHPFGNTPGAGLSDA